MIIRSKKITLISVFMTRDGAPTPRSAVGSGCGDGQWISGRTKIVIGLVGARDRGTATRAIDAQPPRSDGAMVEHSERLLASFRIGEPLAGGREYTITECCITKILSKRASFRNKNRPPAAGNRVHASTPSGGAYDPGTNISEADTAGAARSATVGRIGQGSGVGRLNRMSAFRRPIPYLPRRKAQRRPHGNVRNAG